MSRFLRLLGVLLIHALPVAACIAQPSRAVLDSALALFFDTQYERALGGFEEIVRGNPGSAEARTWLAEAYRRLERPAEAAAEARHALSLDPCYSFAHCVLAQASYPDHDTILTHVKRAIECDPDDPNPWLMMWGEAIREGRPATRDTSLRKLVETGFFTRAALAYGRAELRTLPPDAILITSGDMDTYPAQAVQITEGFRRDVAVVEKEHLGIDWGYRFIRDHQSVPLPFPDAALASLNDSLDAAGVPLTKAEQVFIELVQRKAAGQIRRPIALAPTVDGGFYFRKRANFANKGMYLLWQPGDATAGVDTAALRTCLAGLDPDSFSGPWTSAKDRSPVRRKYTNGIAQILFDIALTYGDALVKGGRYREAEETFRWLEGFEAKTEIGPVSSEQIAQLRAKMQKGRAEE